ncbi:Ig-like domain-containing protein [Caulobacter sp. NIBR2454]|uniref:Ig-like domain-containing protein n=1 Tax=Caulobacter sp. NIBR2454 TaxID=3015996 RepID=UPI0022B61577|nr:Ig-like domain-containing protein [Caulobacter sp. NIBR2454]
MASVIQISRVGAQSTTANTVQFRVAFDEAVNGVSASAFALAGEATGTIGAPSLVSPGVYTVTVSDVAGEGNLRLNLLAGVVTAADDNAAIPAFTSGQAFYIDHTAPTFLGAEAPGPYAYGLVDDEINFLLRFNEDVVVDTTGGAPRIAINVGGRAAWAEYNPSQSGSSDVYLTYRVQPGDNDSDGIEFGAFDLNGAVITDKAGNPAGAFTVGTAPPTPEVTVDTTAPTVVSTTAPAAGIYIPGDDLIFTVTFSEVVDVSFTPVLELDIGGQTVEAQYFEGSGANTLSFRYQVNYEDLDLNGIVVGGTIKFGDIEDDARNAADFTNLSFDTSGVNIDGEGPQVVSITRLDPNNTTATSVRWQLVFDEPIDDELSSWDVYTDGVGTINGDFDIEDTGDHKTWIVTLENITGSGTVRLAYDGGSNDVRDVYGNLSDTPFDAGESYTLNSTAAVVESVSAPANRTYHVGEHIDFTVHMDKAVTILGGTPRIAMEVGEALVYATYVSGSGTADLVFRYTVTNGRLDTDGVEVYSPIDLRGATMRGGDGVDAELALNDIAATTGLLVDGVQPTITANTAPAAGVYGEGDDLTFTVTFDETVVVDTTNGTPYIGLTLPSGGYVHADYVGGSGSSTLTFVFTIPDGAEALDGVSVSSLITSGGGTIKDAAGNSASLNGLTINGSAVIVDAVDPAVLSISRTGDETTTASSVIYTVVFSETVTGDLDASDFVLHTTGSISGAIVSNVSGSGSIFAVQVSGYTGEGTIRLDLKDSGTGITDTAGNPIAGGFTTGMTYTIDTTVPTVTSVTAPAHDTYQAGDVLTFTVTMSEAVTVDTTGGTPRIALTIGSSTVYATYSGGSGTDELTFAYTVTVGQSDADGVALGGAIEANGATLRDAAGQNATLTLSGVATTAGVLVDASNPVIATTSSPAADTYAIGEHLDFTVTFSEDVTVDTSGGTPSIALTLDTGGTVQAEYVSGSGGDTLTFRYAVTAGTLDSDGVMTAGAIALNGGTMQDASGLNAVVTGLNFTGLAGVRVDGIAPTVTSITRVGAASSNAATQHYTVTFGEAVDGVDPSDFVLTATGTAGGTVTGISGSGATYTVTVTDITGDGDLRLDLKNTGTGVTDLHGNAITTGFTAGQTVTFDHTAPAAPTIATVAADDVISANEVSGLTVTGTAEAGSIVKLTIGGAVRTASLSGTTWTYAVTANDLRAMGAGAETLSVTATDAAGNVSTPATLPITVDAAAVPPAPSGGGNPGPVTPDLEPEDVIAVAGDAVGVDLTSAKATSPTITLANGQVVANPLYATAQAAAKLQADLAAGRITVEQAQSGLVDLAMPTTGVAHDVYKFFTGAPPTEAGMTWLIDSPTNANDLTDAYYAAFSVENRYINFAVNLGKVGEGRAGFEAAYGSLSFSESVSKAYDAVIGFDDATEAGFDVQGALRYIESQKAYFDALGGDAIGAKAAMVGYVVSLGGSFHVGEYYEALKEHVIETITDSLSSAPNAGWDLV